MPRARKYLVSLESTPYYHVVSRCVRRAYLCGTDRSSGRSYEHRRAWIEDRVRVLASIFSIELCAYAVMSNHYHLVVRLAPGESDAWSDDDVLARWMALFRGPLLVQRYRTGKPLSEAERDMVRSISAVYRRRLGSLSWFMKCLNEPIARQANAEDGCTGHFWEARFQSQPLRSTRALLSAMVYVDLNPVRARIADTPEQSDYTSVRARCRGGDRHAAVARLRERGELHHCLVLLRPLMPFADPDDGGDALPAPVARLPLRQADYLQLLDATGRVALHGKRGSIDHALAPILERLGFTTDHWIDSALAFPTQYRNGDLRLTQSA